MKKPTVLVRPGDTIAVPLKTDRIGPLTVRISVTQILYQGAIAMAAINTFGNETVSWERFRYIS